MRFKSMTATRRIAALTAAMLLSGCVSTAPKVGSTEAKTVATGSAGGASAQGENTQLEKCASPVGTLSVVEDTSQDWYRILTTQRGLTSTVPVLRMMIQQSNCFVVVERGRAMNNMQQERALQGSGELRGGSNFGKGQMVSADYSMSPEIVFSARGTSGVGGGLGGYSRGLGVLGAVAGGIRTNEASTMLVLVDNRSGVQIGAAEGSSSNTDFNVGVALFGGSAGGAAGGYTNTPQGKVIVASFMDSYNQLVKAVRNYKAQAIPGQGLGTGGKLSVDGAAAPVASLTPTAVGGAMPMKDAQAKLKALGYDIPIADGQLNAKTVAGLRKFQKDRNIAQTGRLDNTTQAELSK
jgi:Putative peptidoglycan binding domain/Curli production assembly/transport component CsgG